MKKVLSLLIAICAVAAASAQIPVLKPVGVYMIPDIPASEYKRLENLYMEGTRKSPLFDLMYTPGASWYDEARDKVARVYASSSLSSQGSNSYRAANIHDFNHETAWVEGVQGHGIGQYVVYEFEMSCPRITTVYILNGYVKSNSAWSANSRVKKLKVYYNNKPIAILELQNSRSMQWFDIGTVGRTGSGPRWSLKFEILEVYPGTKYQDTVISDIMFNGIDVY
jgi:hypothetical protein